MTSIFKRKHRIYTHEEIDDLLAYLTSPDLPRGEITKIYRGDSRINPA
jgi:hypothetical protein